jgi:hypothetical protein
MIWPRLSAGASFLGRYPAFAGNLRGNSWGMSANTEVGVD